MSGCFFCLSFFLFLWGLSTLLEKNAFPFCHQFMFPAFGFTSSFCTKKDIGAKWRSTELREFSEPSLRFRLVLIILGFLKIDYCNISVSLWLQNEEEGI